MPDEVHQQLERRWILYFVVVVDHQLRVQRRDRPVQNPLEAAGVEIAQLLRRLLVVEFLEEILIAEILLIVLLHLLLDLSLYLLLDGLLGVIILVGVLVSLVLGEADVPVVL